MDFLKSVNWQELTTIVAAAITFGVAMILLLLGGFITIIMKWIEVKKALALLSRKSDKQDEMIDKHKETIINLAEASPEPTKELLKPML